MEVILGDRNPLPSYCINLTKVLDNLISPDKILLRLPFKFYVLCQRNKLEKNLVYPKDEAPSPSTEGALVRNGVGPTCCILGYYGKDGLLKQVLSR